jgi:hypothetical protein
MQQESVTLISLTPGNLQVCKISLLSLIITFFNNNRNTTIKQIKLNHE